MSDSGYIVVNRDDFFRTDLWTAEPFAKGQAWLDLYSLASYKEQKIWIRGFEIQLKRGELAWSEVSLSKRWRWSRNKVRRFFDWLRTEQLI